MMDVLGGLGDAGTDNTGYEPPDESLFSLEYVRRKWLDFQQLLSAIDDARAAAIGALETGVLDTEAGTSLTNAVMDIDSHRSELLATMDAANGIAAIVNASGGRMPVLSSGLGIAPAIPLGAIAVLGGIAALTIWGRDVIAVIAQVIRYQAADPGKRDALIDADARAALALRKSEGSTLGQLASIAKWGGLAVLGVLGVLMLRRR